jgi:hypothetical protein
MEIIKGRRHVYIVSVREENDAFDLAGYEAELVVCRGVGSEPTLKKKGIVGHPSSGNAEFTLLPEDLVDAEAGHYRFEVNIWKTEDDTVVYTPVEGSLELREALDGIPATV